MRSIFGGVVAGLAFLGLMILVFNGLGGSGGSDEAGGNNVSMVDGKQIIEISAKGGYSPRNTVAKAGLPTILRMKTNGTFDCSGALVIPAIQYQENLPMSGTTDIDLPAQTAGKTLQGLCAMGMKNFTVKFE